MSAWGSSADAGDLTIAIAFGNQELSDDALRILLQRELHGLFQRELYRSG